MGIPKGVYFPLFFSLIILNLLSDFFLSITLDLLLFLFLLSIFDPVPPILVSRLAFLQNQGALFFIGVLSLQHFFGQVVVAKDGFSCETHCGDCFDDLSGVFVQVRDFVFEVHQVKFHDDDFRLGIFAE